MNKTLRWIIAVIGNKNWYVAALTVLQGVSGFTGVLYALFLRNAIDHAVAHEQHDFFVNAGCIVALVIVDIALGAILRWLRELAKSDVENLLKKRLTDNILRRQYSYVSAVHSGEWMNRLTNDTVFVANAYVEILPGLVGTIVRLVSALVMLIALDRWFAFIMIPGGLLLIILTYVFRKNLKVLHKNIQQKDGALRVFLQERIGSLMIIKSFASEDMTEAEAEVMMDAHKDARMKRNRFSNICNIGFSAAMKGLYFIGVLYCAYGIMTGRVSYGTLTAIMQLIGQVQSPFANISGYVPRFYAMTASAERIMEIEEAAYDHEGEIMDEVQIRSYYDNDFDSIHFDKVCFEYPARQDSTDTASLDLTETTGMPVISNFSLSIGKGEYVAFTGRSGCGKSTMLKLLMCMYEPVSGRITIHQKDGEAKELTPAFRRLFAYVPQENLLLQGSIRNAVSFASGTDYGGKDETSADDRSIWRALRTACAEDFVKDLELGLDTELGERGAGLSEGQMQRIAVARALYSGAPILLLDEATSALDEKTEQQLLENLRKMTDLTVLLVTHRKSSAEICDREIEMTNYMIRTEDAK